MIIDKDLMFSDDQEVKASGNSTVLDLGAAGDAVGQELTIHGIVTTAFAGATSLTIAVQTSEDKSTYTTLVQSGAIPVADLTRGAEVFCVRCPKGFKRYIRLAYTIAGTGTAGKVTAFASKDL